MAFYTNLKPQAESAQYITESFDEVVASAIEEGFEYTGMDFDEMAMGHVVEAEENYNKLMMAIGIHEASEFAKTGEEVVYTEGVLTDIKDKIVAFVKSVWNKIVSIFKRFIAMFDAWNKDDKAFLDKYKSEIVKRMGKMKDFKFTGYKFSNLDNTAAAITECQTQADIYKKNDNPYFTKATGDDKSTDTETNEEKFDDNIETMRGTILKKIDSKAGTSYTASEFSKGLFEAYRSGESSKQELDDKDINISTIMNELATNKEAKKTAKENYDKAKRVCDGFIKDLESADKTAIKGITGKSDDADADKEKAALSRSLNLQIRYIKAALSIMQVVNGAHLTALKDRSRQNKAICAKLVGTVKAESASWEHNIEEGASFLSSVTLR